MLASHPGALDLDRPTGPTGLDLRLHSPMPAVVVLRVSGAVDEVTAPLLAERVCQQCPRARHVVVDLSDVTSLAAGGLDMLRTLQQRTTRAGACLYFAAEHPAVRRPLLAAGLDRVSPVSCSADLIVATLACRAAGARAGHRRSGAFTGPCPPPAPASMVRQDREGSLFARG